MVSDGQTTVGSEAGFAKCARLHQDRWSLSPQQSAPGMASAETPLFDLHCHVAMCYVLRARASYKGHDAPTVHAFLSFCSF